MASRSRSMKDLDLLLIGKTGMGKSATGNSILLRKVFTSRSSFQSVTEGIESELSEYNDRAIQVVDTPGVGDTRIDQDDKAKDFIITSLQKAIAASTLGYHAFLLVIKFGSRFTEEDKSTIEFLKLIFGEDFVKKFCIIIMTNGDGFERESEDTNVKFHDWCLQQTGVFASLYKECQHRAVLFDNVTKDNVVKQKQLDRLLEVIDNLWTPGHRYSDINFAEAAKARREIMIKSKMPEIMDDVMKEISLIEGKYEQIMELETEAQEVPLGKLVGRCNSMFTIVKYYDEDTDVLRELKDTVIALKNTIDGELKLCQRMAPKERQMQEKLHRTMSMEMSEWKKNFEQDQAQQRQQVQDTKKLCLKLKKKYKKGIAEKVVDVATWPLRITAKGIDKAGRKITGKSKKDKSSTSDC